MELFFSPMTCSLATRMALYESGQQATFTQVDLRTKKTTDGRNYWEINPKGQVPCLLTDGGQALTENAAILQFVADQAPGSGLAAPAGDAGRYQLQQWLSFVGAEIHKQVFYAIFNPQSPPEVRAHAKDHLLPPKYDYLSKHLADREFLTGEQFTVADAYLTTTFNWTGGAQIDLSQWPVLSKYHKAMTARPAVAKAMGEEMALRQQA